MATANDSVTIGCVSGFLVSGVTELVIGGDFKNAEALHRLLILGSAGVIGGFIAYSVGLLSNIEIMLFSGSIAAFSLFLLSTQRKEISKD